MISLKSFLNKICRFCCAALLCLSGCAGTASTIDVEKPPAVAAQAPLAVFPIENLSGTVAPLKVVRESLIRQLRAKGFAVLDDDALERFMIKNRIRYTGGLDEAMAKALREETGVKGVLITSLELYNETAPPKVALTSRLVATGEIPAIEWVDGVGMAGDDAPGILSLGLVEDPRLLLEKALGKLTASLAEHFSQRAGGSAEKIEKKFQPRISYRSGAWEPGKKYAVAVAPFFNRSERKNAGEVMTLHFIQDLEKSGNFDVVEPGLIRKAFLASRIIMDEGISLPEANVLFTALDVDLVLSGKVLDYQDFQGGYGTPKVNFSVQLIERKSQQVVWSSVSYREGDEGVYFFDWGRVNTAHALASRMVHSVEHMISER